MIIGTDQSLEECKRSGYLMMEYNARKKANYTDSYKFFKYNPYRGWNMQLKKLRKEELEQNFILFSLHFNAEFLIETYLEYKKDIDKFIGTNHDRLLTFPKDITYHEILYLADSIDGYKGFYCI